MRYVDRDEPEVETALGRVRLPIGRYACRAEGRRPRAEAGRVPLAAYATLGEPSETVGLMPTIADLLRALDESEATRHVRAKLASQRGVNPDRLARSLASAPEDLLKSLTGRQIALALARTLTDADLRTLALRVIDPFDQPVTDNFGADGWSRPLRVRPVMRQLAGWTVIPDAVQSETWNTILGKLRARGYEVRNPDENPGINGRIVIRKIFPD